ncbi:MAG TPA: TIR domain-containing protein [Caulobacteraceae bacterium]|nr:TIR domain-containing protein [Caulobacteraceae bacterium]
MSDIFISYARSTEAQAKQFAEALRALGYGVWRDDEIPANRAYADVIAERLTTAKAVVVIWSAEAVKSQWVRSEAERARAEDKLVQLSVDGARLPMPFEQTQCADLSGWAGEATPGWKQVVDAIANLASPSRPQNDPPRKAARKLSICVLPFANISDDPQQEYFSDGISEDIITDLSRVSALAIASRNSAFAYKGKSTPIGQVAGDLGVSHIVEGSVRKVGNRVRITAQLIEAASDTHVWAQRWDRDLDDIFALQDEISQAIVAALKIRLLPNERRAMERRGTANVEAYDIYLLARLYLDSGSRGDSQREKAVVRLTRRAVELDPQYARAWALLSYGLSSIPEESRGGDSDGLAEAERALALDPDCAEAHAARANALAFTDKLEAGVAEAELALKLDPESYDANRVAGRLFYYVRRFRDAADCFTTVANQAQADFSQYGMIASCYVALGDRDAAKDASRACLERVEKILAHDRINSHAMAYAADALAVLGEGDRAREWMRRAILIDPENWLMRYNFSCALGVNLNDADGAIELLRPVMEGSATRLLISAATDPDLDPIREDPRFQQMLAVAKARIAAHKPAA